MSKNTIPVTRTSLPSFEDYAGLIKTCWESHWLTNNGQLVQRLEKELSDYFQSPHFLLTNNGTTALQLSIKCLGLSDEIITTPFSYVATTSSILWENCKPIFVDISPDDLCIDVAKIEAKITKNTTAILAVHVYGNPCDVEALEALSKKYNLKVIYDAAHAFGVKYKNKHLVNFGDASILSFHATKLFHSIEGGAIVCRNSELAQDIGLRRSFGHIQDDHLTLGINGKMNEFQAAMGLCNLPRMSSILASRKRVYEIYQDGFVNRKKLKLVSARKGTEINYSYYPVILDSENTCLHLIEKLKVEGILTRRYFFPSLNTLHYLEYQSCPVSEDISKRILCLPMYSDLTEEEAKMIVKKTCEVLESL